MQMNNLCLFHFKVILENTLRWSPDNFVKITSLSSVYSPHDLYYTIQNLGWLSNSQGMLSTNDM